MKDELLIPFGAILGLSFFAFLVKFVKGKEQESAPEPDDEEDDGYGEDEYFWRVSGGEVERGDREFRLDNKWE